MKKFVFLIFLLVTIFKIAGAQGEDLFVKSGRKGLYIDHKVTPKQGLFAVGRLYNVHPRYIAEYNGVGFDDGLALGQILHIPLTDTNFSQKGYSGTPVYYRVGNNNENLQQISNANNHVSTQLIKDWNNLKGDVPRSGVKLIIGFLHSNELASITIDPPAGQEPAKPQTEEKPVVKNNEVAKTEVKEEPPKEEPKAVMGEQPKKEEVKQVTGKEQPKQEEPQLAVKNEVVKEETKPVLTEQEKPVTAIPGGSGYFKAYFEEQVKTNPAEKSLMVTAGIFKTTSGVREAKYYMLIDGVVPGTIVKILNPANGKLVYAKVLGEMNGIRLNQGYDIRISESAALALEATPLDKFIVKVNY